MSLFMENPHSLCLPVLTFQNVWIDSFKQQKRGEVLWSQSHVQSTRIAWEDSSMLRLQSDRMVLGESAIPARGSINAFAYRNCTLSWVISLGSSTLWVHKVCWIPGSQSRFSFPPSISQVVSRGWAFPFPLSLLAKPFSLRQCTINFLDQ